MIATVDVEAPVPRAVLQARLDGLHAWMRAQDLDALVVFAQGNGLGTATRTSGHLRYLIDWGGDVAPSALVLRREGGPVLVAGSVFLRLLAEEEGWLPVVLGRGPQFARAILDALPADAARIALVGREEMPLAMWGPLADAGAASWIDASAELERRRVRKDAVQIAYHRRAAAICDELFERVGPELRTGKAVFQIQATLECVARSAGCEYAQTWLTVGPVVDRPRYWRDENRHTPKPGDQVALGLMLIYHGHWAHALRTGAVGEPTPATREVYGVVQRMHAAMLAALQPGQDLRAVNDAAESIVEAYLARAGAPPHFRFRSGHGLGHSYEDPVVSAAFAQPYEGVAARGPMMAVAPGMLFEVHPNLFIPGYGGASIGDTVLVTERGPEVLTRYPTALARWDEGDTER